MGSIGRCWVGHVSGWYFSSSSSTVGMLICFNSLLRMTVITRDYFIAQSQTVHRLRPCLLMTVLKWSLCSRRLLVLRMLRRLCYMTWSDSSFSTSGCEPEDDDVMDCLRNVDINALAYAGSQNILSRPSQLYPFSPILDESFINNRPVEAFTTGKFARVPTLFGYDITPSALPRFLTITLYLQ